MLSNKTLKTWTWKTRANAPESICNKFDVLKNIKRMIEYILWWENCNFMFHNRAWTVKKSEQPGCNAMLTDNCRNFIYSTTRTHKIKIGCTTLQKHPTEKNKKRKLLFILSFHFRKIAWESKQSVPDCKLTSKSDPSDHSFSLRTEFASEQKRNKWAQANISPSERSTNKLSCKFFDSLWRQVEKNS